MTNSKLSDALYMTDNEVRAGRPCAEDAESLTDRILMASWDLLLDIGFEKFSFDKLAKYGRFGKPTIYARFSGKVELLRALLMLSIETTSRGFFESVADQHIDKAIPSLCADGVEFFHSPEGRLKDRLIDWLDLETDDNAPSMRGWTLKDGLEKISALLKGACEREEVTISDIDTASLFLIEGIVGHARMTSVEDQFDREKHILWASRYWAMIRQAFAVQS
ncbi:hypothetical protein LPB140_03085 [Sphingorhabdus lutea]|uniref:HTH tetR-type domain-containing protein n=1 Tax=Sphingorhabdus lutea TaxID=1913578 RepID=A0A1L3JA23_9SPHN|nr:TetR/AcrR family transcriptional regulator [Sphingorhabdus lutea]APG61974.1 hypothetical protein LPB140_03085 [Sphingorhabdus lutea]